jgi:uncharacterized protein (DUF1810 family)
LVSPPDLFQLQRFVAAQDRGGTYRQALSELRVGRKTSHWIWFVFPQLAGLGQSEMSRRYAISGLEEAQAYLAHSVLGPRLVECCEALLSHHDRSALEILGGIDAVKLRSSMTLFAHAAPEPGVFEQILERYFDGEADAATMDLLAASP